jgi:hypothetical protein
MDLPCFGIGIVHLKIKGFQYQNMYTKIELPTVLESRARLQRGAGWPGSILVTNVNHFQFQQNMG